MFVCFFCLGDVLGDGDGLGDVEVMIPGAGAGLADMTGEVSEDDGGFLFLGEDAGGSLLCCW